LVKCATPLSERRYNLPYVYTLKTIGSLSVAAARPHTRMARSDVLNPPEGMARVDVFMMFRPMFGALAAHDVSRSLVPGGQMITRCSSGRAMFTAGDVYTIPTPMLAR
jgi:hypothetical protein